MVASVAMTPIRPFLVAETAALAPGFTTPAVSIYGKACPLFVPLVEEGLLEDPVTDEIARRYLTELIDIDIDTQGLHGIGAGGIAGHHDGLYLECT